MKRLAVSFFLSIFLAFPALAQEYYDVDVDLPAFPEMLPVPDSPVYYAPSVDSNYFYYDGLYWDFYNDGWYSSPWYNGPWSYVDPVYVPTYVLWVPIAYYHRPPHYFHAWHRDRPPRWSERWGRDWQHRHNQVYRGSHRAHVAAAPLPHYQRQYTRQNYPRAVPQQAAIHNQHFAYQPREAIGRQQYQNRGMSQNPAQRPAQSSQKPTQGGGVGQGGVGHNPSGQGR
jgi:hypothetical protein